MAAGVALAPAAGAQTPQSSDATLFSLSIESDIAQTRMFPAFDPAVERYDVAVPSGETEVTVKVKTNDPGASAVLESTRSGRCCIEELDYDANTDAYTLELRTDRYTYMTIKVTAANGTEKQYDLRIDVASRDEKGWRVYNDVPMDRLVDEPQLPSHYIRGLWADDSRVLTTARRHGTKDGEFDLDQKLYAFDAADSSRLPDEEFVLSGRPYAGIWSDGTTLWALNTDGTLRAYKLSDGSEITGWSVDLSPDGYYDTREVYEPRGIWSDGDTLWVTGKDDADNAKGFAFELPKGCNSCRKSSLDFELSGDNDNPWGITGNDDTWWVTEVGEDGFTTDTRTIYAYNRSDGTRDTDKDIDLSELTTTHLQQLYYGLAATDTIMYVAEYITGRVHSFNMPGVSGPVAPSLNSSDATLSGLSLNNASLSPGFSSSHTIYHAGVEPDITSTTVTATPNPSARGAVVKVGGTIIDGEFVGGTTYTDGVVPLNGPGTTTTILIFVTAQDGTKKTYTVEVHRRAPNTDATLDMLELSSVTLVPAFLSATETYTASVANGVESTTVTATPNDSAASYVVQLDGVTDADGTIDLAVGANVITVVVTAEDGQTTKTYEVTVTRAEPPPNTDATLDMLDLTDVTLVPAFLSATETYTASVANGVVSTTVSATPNDSAASYVVQLDGVTDADGTIDLAVGANVITVVVTAEDGQTTKTYEVTVTRAEPPPNTDATLDMLDLTDVTLVPAFLSATETYTASVANGVESTTVSATPNDAAASYVVQDDGVDDGDGVVPLDVGANVITVVVTAADDTTTKTYTVTVTRATSSSQPPVNSNPGTYNPGTYNPGTYNPGTYNPGTYNPGTYNPGTSNPGGGGSNPGTTTVGESSGDGSDSSDGESDDFTPLDDAGDAGTDTEAAINALHRLGVFTGTLCQSNRLCPNDPLQRWIAAVWLVRLIDGDDPAAVTESRFEDVNASSMWEESVWYAPHVERLWPIWRSPWRLHPVVAAGGPVELGCPDVNLTRAQVASWVARAFDLASDESQGFVDAVGSVHEANINAVVAAGVMSGCSTSPKNFCLTDTVTKGEMARYVYAARNVSLGLS